MIEYRQGNLLESGCTVIAHGCNCFHTMGGGIAKQLRTKWPQVYSADLKTVWGGDKLGTISIAVIDNSPTRYVFNLYTQYRYGRDKQYADYDAIRACMLKLKRFTNEYPDYTIGIPRIGAGLAGGNWKIIEQIINDIFCDRIIYVYDWNNNKQNKKPS